MPTAVSPRLSLEAHPPDATQIHLRTSAQNGSGDSNGSSSLIQTTRQAFLNGNDGNFFEGFL
ncbi:MAG: hypothetical protein WBP53_11815 [Dokdonella sp.]